MTAEPRTFDFWKARAAAARPEGRALIDGGYVSAITGETFERVSPIDGRIVARIARGRGADIDAAVAAARRAFEDGRWHDAEPAHRKRVMLRLADLMRANREELALLETLDVGKPIRDSLAVDVDFAANCIQFYAECIDKLYDEIAPTGPNDLALVRREALGVVGAIVPWNYPLIISAWKIGPALAIGNSVVLKPAEQSSLTAIRLAALALEAGLPAGVLNVVPGLGEEAGSALCRHMDVDMIAFTGSTEVGKLVMQAAATSNLKRVALELGGKSPQVVLADCADLDAAASAIAWSIFYNQGETCHAGSRVVADVSIRGALIEKVKGVVATIPLGHPLDPATAMGALIDAGHMQRVLGFIEGAVADGATIAHGGRQAMAATGGFYVEATVLDDVRPAMRVAREEVFGPVLSIIPVEGEEAALRVANDTSYGLAAAVWTGSMASAHRFARKLRAGTVWINSYDLSSMSTPFGGFKQSGFGRDRSVHAIDKYADLKTVWQRFG